jgi:hypothetical protein
MHLPGADLMSTLTILNIIYLFIFFLGVDFLNLSLATSKIPTLFTCLSGYFLFKFLWGGMRLSPLGTSATNWPIVPAPECGALGGMRIGKGNRSTWRKPVLVPLCPPQIPHDLNSVA